MVRPQANAAQHAGQKRKGPPGPIHSGDGRQPKKQRQSGTIATTSATSMTTSNRSTKSDRQPRPQTQKPESAKRRDALSSGKAGKSSSSAVARRRTGQLDARKIATQTTSKSFKNGALDVDQFVKAREFEVRALQDAMVRSKRALTSRAFQLVPREMRRRSGAWNTSKVPGRLRERAIKEVKEDGTKTGKARERGAGRKLGRHAWLRKESTTVKRKEGTRRPQGRSEQEVMPPKPREDGDAVAAATKCEMNGAPLRTRIRTDYTLSEPPTTKMRFKKRQLRKTWLPTHLFHAKRAHMSSPTDPLWGFALPLSPTVKSYRPTHRAVTESGAIVWDNSYVSTIGLEGVERSLLGLLKALGFHEAHLGHSGLLLWKMGRQVWQGLLKMRDTSPPDHIAPVTVLWQALSSQTDAAMDEVECLATLKRKVFLRTHPAAFLQLWEQVIRLCKVQKPEVKVEDLRYEIGSIEIIGPAATEALQGALWPSAQMQAAEPEGHESKEDDGHAWKALNGLDNPATLSPGAALAFKITDPRLHFPPRTVVPPVNTDALIKCLRKTGQSHPAIQAIFEGRIRRAAVAAMPSQKAINRRKGNSPPGAYPEPMENDPHIPILLYTSTFPSSSAVPNIRSKPGPTSWTVLLPWSAVPAIWQSLNYYPLSTGGQVRLGGQDEQRQLAFESCTPWWPGDFPGTDAGNSWIAKESEKRHKEWLRKPPSRRVNYEGLELGNNEKSEIGHGWGTDFNLVTVDSAIGGAAHAVAPVASGDKERTVEERTDNIDGSTSIVDKSTSGLTPSLPGRLWHCPAAIAASALNQGKTSPAHAQTALVTVRLTFLGRGAPTAGARVYRLPTTDDPLHQRWLTLLPPRYSASRGGMGGASRGKPKRPQARILPSESAVGASKVGANGIELYAPRPKLTPGSTAQSEHPPVPRRADLIGFVTSGGFNLKEGKGTAIANLSLGRLLEDVHGGAGADEERDSNKRLRKVCIVRNAGEVVGRLACWDIV